MIYGIIYLFVLLILLGVMATPRFKYWFLESYKGLGEDPGAQDKFEEKTIAAFIIIAIAWPVSLSIVALIKIAQYLKK